MGDTARATMEPTLSAHFVKFSPYQVGVMNRYETIEDLAEYLVENMSTRSLDDFGDLFQLDLGELDYDTLVQVFKKELVKQLHTNSCEQAVIDNKIAFRARKEAELAAKQ